MHFGAPAHPRISTPDYSTVVLDRPQPTLLLFFLKKGKVEEVLSNSRFEFISAKTKYEFRRMASRYDVRRTIVPNFRNRPVKYARYPCLPIVDSVHY